MNENTHPLRCKRWICIVLLSIVAVLILYAAVTVYIDPLFHYHAPISSLQYPINDERYQNDGILRNFEYDSVITGTSMCEKFKTSEAEDIWGGTFVKVPLSGARYKEIDSQLERAYSHGKNIRLVIRGLDLGSLIMDKGAIRDGYNPPEFLYNNNVFDDVEYLFNKTLFMKNLKVLEHTRRGLLTTDFDSYAVLVDPEGDSEAVLTHYTVNERASTQQHLSDEDRVLILENLSQNVISLVEQHPETEFYYFFTPYSVAYWDELDSLGTLTRQLEAISLAAKELVKYPNLKLFNFCADFNTVSNLDNYLDQAHYTSSINSLLLQYMVNGEYLLTEENCEESMAQMIRFYEGYDYTSLHTPEG